ncbi:UNVERIFIED_CONTAM: hypothetical protein FKN15_052065 [Acipenser sinensis]
METYVDVPVETQVRPEVKDSSVQLDGEPESGLEPVDVDPTQDTEPKEGRIPPVSEPEFTEPRRSGREVKPIVRLTYDAPGYRAHLLLQSSDATPFTVWVIVFGYRSFAPFLND